MDDRSHSTQSHLVTANGVVKGLLQLTRANERLAAVIATRLRLSLHEVRALILASDQVVRTPSEYAVGLELPAPTITAVLDRLESARLAVRTRDGRDRRKVRIRLTDEGKSVIRWIQGQWREALVQLDRDVTDRLAADLALITRLVMDRVESVPDTSLPNRTAQSRHPRDSS